MTCTHESHASIRRDPARFYRETRRVGVQFLAEALPLYLGQCDRCGSTLTRVLTPAQAAEEYVNELQPGRFISDETPEISAFRSYIPAAMSRRGWHVEKVPFGWVVEEMDPRTRGLLERIFERIRGSRVTVPTGHQPHQRERARA